MPMTRKVYKRPDGSRVLTLPKTWFETAEKKEGKTIEEVFIEVNEAIIVKPKFKEEKK